MPNNYNKHNMKTIFLKVFFLFFVITNACAANHFSNDVVEQRAALEQPSRDNSFLISFYKPTYFLPAYYTVSPYREIYNGTNQQNLKNLEFKFQFSLKVPIIHQIFGYKSILYFAYTQLSYWQAYASSPFFRESNYEPELDSRKKGEEA